MKILKKATQKNLLVDTFEYKLDVLNTLLRRHEVFYLNEENAESYDEITDYDLGHIDIRVFTEKLDRVVVELDEDGRYRTVAYFKEEIFLAAGKLFVTLY